MGAILPFPSLHFKYDCMEQVGASQATLQLQQLITQLWLTALGVPMNLEDNLFFCFVLFFYCEVTSQSEHVFSISVTSPNDP